MSKGKFALGALFGAVAGVIAGVLTAPKSGKETRANLKAKADELKKDTDKAVEEAKKKGEKVYKDTKKHVETAVEEGRKTVDDYRERSGRAAASAKEEFSKSARETQKK